MCIWVLSVYKLQDVPVWPLFLFHGIFISNTAMPAVLWIEKAAKIACS